MGCVALDQQIVRILNAITASQIRCLIFPQMLQICCHQHEN